MRSTPSGMDRGYFRVLSHVVVEQALQQRQSVAYMPFVNRSKFGGSLKAEKRCPVIDLCKEMSEPDESERQDMQQTGSKMLPQLQQ